MPVDKFWHHDGGSRHGGSTTYQDGDLPFVVTLDDRGETVISAEKPLMLSSQTRPDVLLDVASVKFVKDHVQENALATEPGKNVINLGGRKRIYNAPNLARKSYG